MKITNQRLEEICSAMVTDCSYDYEQVFDNIKAGEIYAMAKELLTSRKELEVWVDWDGDISPLYEPIPGQTLVTVRFRDGSEDTDKAYKYCWAHSDMSEHSDIIAYKIIESEEV